MFLPTNGRSGRAVKHSGVLKEKPDALADGFSGFPFVGEITTPTNVGDGTEPATYAFVFDFFIFIDISINF